MSNKQAKRERQRMRAAGEVPKCDAKAKHHQAIYEAGRARIAAAARERAKWDALPAEEQQLIIEHDRRLHRAHIASSLRALAMVGHIVGSIR